MENETFYEAYGQYTDKLETGFKLKIEHHVEYESHRIGRPEIAEQVKFSPAELKQKRQESAKLEQEIYDKMLGTVKEWEVQAAHTLLLDKALEYANTPAVAHTSNEWAIRIGRTRRRIKRAPGSCPGRWGSTSRPAPKRKPLSAKCPSRKRR